MPGTDFFDMAVSCAMPSGVTDVSRLSVMSTAVGPANMLPSTVGDTRMPLPSFEGVWKITVFTQVLLRSSSMYSPLRGRTENESSPSMRLISSENTPAALTT